MQLGVPMLCIMPLLLPTAEFKCRRLQGPGLFVSSTKEGIVRALGLLTSDICGLSCLLVLQLFKAPHFTIGSTGSMRSSRCHAEISGDGRFVTAGAADGQVSMDAATAATWCCSLRLLHGRGWSWQGRG